MRDKLVTASEVPVAGLLQSSNGGNVSQGRGAHALPPNWSFPELGNATPHHHDRTPRVDGAASWRRPPGTGCLVRGAAGEKRGCRVPAPRVPRLPGDMAEDG